MADGGDELVFHAVEGKALADVAEAEHGTGEAALVEDGGERILGGEGAAVAAEDGGLARGGEVLVEGAEELAVLVAEAAAGRPSVEQIMERQSIELLRTCAQQAPSRRVDQVGRAAAIRAADAVVDRIQQDLLGAVQLLQAILFTGAGQHLSDAGGDGFQGGHGLALFTLALMTVELEHRDEPVADMDGNGPAGRQLMAQCRLGSGRFRGHGQVFDPHGVALLPDLGREIEDLSGP